MVMSCLNGLCVTHRQVLLDNWFHLVAKSDVLIPELHTSTVEQMVEITV